MIRHDSGNLQHEIGHTAESTTVLKKQNGTEQLAESRFYAQHYTKTIRHLAVHLAQS